MVRALRILALACALLAASSAIAAGPRRQMIGCRGTAPTYRATGAVSSSATAAAPGLPSGTVAGDLLIMFCEHGDGTLTASDWTQLLTETTQAGTRLTVLWKYAAGSDATTTNDSGDHQICRISGITLNTYCPFQPFGPITQSNQATTVSVSATGITTTATDQLVFTASAGDLPNATGTAQFSAAANTSCGTVTERIDNTSTVGNGGALFVSSCPMTTVGAVGPGTATAATTAVRNNAMFAVNGR